MFSLYDHKNSCSVSHETRRNNPNIECTGEEKFNRNNALRYHIKKYSLPAVVVANDC